VPEGGERPFELEHHRLFSLRPDVANRFELLADRRSGLGGEDATEGGDDVIGAQRCSVVKVRVGA
jgi:hypothetical protein